MKDKKIKVEKVNDNVIRIIVERTSEVAMNNLISNRQYLLQQKEQLESQYNSELKKVSVAIRELDEMIEKAETVGVKEVKNDSKDNKNPKKV